jgi:hypothetical protein
MDLEKDIKPVQTAGEQHAHDARSQDIMIGIARKQKIKR